MSVRLFVGNLAYDVTEAELKEFFAPAGVPTSVRLPTDRETGKPRGFAFVEFADRTQAEEAIRRFNGQRFKGRPLAVNEARGREAPAPDRGPRAAPGARPFSPAARPASPAGRPPLREPSSAPRDMRERDSFRPEPPPRSAGWTPQPAAWGDDAEQAGQPRRSFDAPLRARSKRKREGRKDDEERASKRAFKEKRGKRATVAEEEELDQELDEFARWAQEDGGDDEG